MNIFVSSFQCESNTFCSRTAGYEDFFIAQGPAVLDHLAAVPLFQTLGCSVIPGVFASALPAGTVEQQACLQIVGLLCEKLEAAQPVDGIYLYVHGAMYVQGLGSGEAYLVSQVRKTVGPEVPIAVAMDFHADIDPEMLKDVQVIHSFRTAPHVDQDETEKRTARSLIRCIKEQLKPRMSRVFIPIIQADAAVTTKEPLEQVMEHIEALDRRQEVLSAAFLSGQPWYDASYTGTVIICSYTGDGKEVHHQMHWIASYLWSNREQYSLEMESYPPHEAVQVVLKSQKRPIVITDSGDNTTAGAEGNRLFLLKLFLKELQQGGGHGKKILFCGITQPQVLHQLDGLPEGKAVSCTLEDEDEQGNADTMAVQGTLIKWGDVLGWSGERAGTSAVLSLHDAVDVVLTDVRAAYISLPHITASGVNPREYDIVVLKLGYLFDQLRGFAEQSVFALTPGTGTNDFSTLAYEHISRPIYPIDDSFAYEPAVEVYLHNTEEESDENPITNSEKHRRQ